MSRIVLATSGSFGDVHPYLAVALGLKARGHQVILATAEFYRHKVQGEGLGFHPVRPNFVPMTAPAEVVRQSFDPRHGAYFVLRQLAWISHQRWRKRRTRSLTMITARKQRG